MADTLSMTQAAIASEFTPTALTDVTDIAETVLEHALNCCVQQMRLPGRHAVADHLRIGNRRATGYFQYELACQVANYLGSLDDEAKAVYLYDYDATADDITFGEATPAPLVHLIAWVGRKTNGLNALVTGLDRALAERYAELVNRPDLAHVLDVQVVDDADVQKRVGYGALLSSLNLRPMQVWQR